MVNAQEWLNKNYPPVIRKEITELNSSYKKLEGNLNLTGFTNLERLDCSHNRLTFIDINNCKQLKEIKCGTNRLTGLDLSGISQLRELYFDNNCIGSLDNSKFSNSKLIKLNISNNSFSAQELTFLDNLVDLKVLDLSSNKFFGSLEPLKHLTKLEELNISNTDIDNGLEYLPDSLRFFKCSTDQRPEAKVSKLYEQLLTCGWSLKFWKEDYLGSNDFKKQNKIVFPVIDVPKQLFDKKEDIFKENYNLKKVNYPGFILRDNHHFSWEVSQSKFLFPKRLPLKLYNIEKSRVEWTENNFDIKNYAVLSYIWGGDFNKETGELSCGGRKSLAKAIYVCKMFGINHLWMDQLCIDSYSFEEQKQEVPKIYQHYDNAEVTLVSINIDADNKKATEENRLVTHILKRIVRSEWFSSPWTFQEGLLSRQMIFLFDDILIDGRVMAQVWTALQWSDDYRELNENSRVFATPLGWTYGYNSEDKVTLKLFEAMNAIKNRKKVIPVDGIYSIIGLLPYGEQIKIKYKPRICLRCLKGEEGENCKHSDENKQFPVYAKEELEEILSDVVRVAVKNNYAEPLTWFGPRRNKSDLCWIPNLDNNGSIADFIGVVKGELQCMKCESGNIEFAKSQVKLVGSQHIIETIWMERLEEEWKFGDNSLNDYNLQVTTTTGNCFSLSGTGNTLSLMKKGDILIIPWKNVEFFAILVPEKNNINCPIEVVKILTKELLAEQTFFNLAKEELIIDMVNKKVIRLDRISEKLREIKSKTQLTIKTEDRIKELLEMQKQLTLSIENNEISSSFFKEQLEREKKTKEEINKYLTLEEINSLCRIQVEITKVRIQFEQNLLIKTKIEIVREQNQWSETQIQVIDY